MEFDGKYGMAEESEMNRAMKGKANLLSIW